MNNIEQTENVFQKRKRTRLKDYDYSEPGYYYVTICTHNRINWFGEIHNEEMILNDASQMVDSTIHRLPEYFSNILINIHIVMPNHTHIIYEIIKPVGDDLRVVPEEELNQNETFNVGRTQRSAPTAILSLSNVIKRFKMITTKHYIDGVKNNKWKPFDKHLWQRSFYDHIIRTDESLHKIREYIMNNPAQWDDDVDNINKNL